MQTIATLKILVNVQYESLAHHSLPSNVQL